MIIIINFINFNNQYNVKKKFLRKFVNVLQSCELRKQLCGQFLSFNNTKSIDLLRQVHMTMDFIFQTITVRASFLPRFLSTTIYYIEN